MSSPALLIARAALPVTRRQAVPTCACMALSVAYHTFMNCICCYRRLLIADVMGIWFTMFFGFSLFFLQSCILPTAPVLKAAFMSTPPLIPLPPFPNFLSSIIAALPLAFTPSFLFSSAYVAVGLITLFFLICARSAMWRAATLLGMSLIRALSVTYAILTHSASRGHHALWYWAFMEFFVVLGAAINVPPPPLPPLPWAGNPLVLLPCINFFLSRCSKCRSAFGPAASIISSIRTRSCTFSASSDWY
jgi:hypothetical protein